MSATPPVPAAMSCERARALLGQLGAAHREVIAGVEALAEVTRQANATSDYACVRWKLSRASRARRALIATICSEVASAVTEAEARLVDGLQRDDRVALHISAAHVQTWTVERIAAQWGDYRKASELMRIAMKQRVVREESVLGAVLRRLAG